MPHTLLADFFAPPQGAAAPGQAAGGAPGAGAQGHHGAHAAHMHSMHAQHAASHAQHYGQAAPAAYGTAELDEFLAYFPPPASMSAGPYGHLPQLGSMQPMGSMHAHPHAHPHAHAHTHAHPGLSHAHSQHQQPQQQQQQVAKMPRLDAGGANYFDWPPAAQAPAPGYGGAAQQAHHHHHYMGAQPASAWPALPTLPDLNTLMGSPSGAFQFPGMTASPPPVLPAQPGKQGKGGKAGKGGGAAAARMRHHVSSSSSAAAGSGGASPGSSSSSKKKDVSRFTITPTQQAMNGNKRLDGEKRLAVEFENMGELGALPQLLGPAMGKETPSELVYVPDGLRAAYRAYGQRWIVETHHVRDAGAGALSARGSGNGDDWPLTDSDDERSGSNAAGAAASQEDDKVCRVRYVVSCPTSGLRHEAVESMSCAMRRTYGGRTLCNRTFKQAVRMRRAELERQLESVMDPGARVVLAKEIEQISVSRVSEGPLYFCLRHAALQNKMRELATSKLGTAAPSAAAAAVDAGAPAAAAPAAAPTPVAAPLPLPAPSDALLDLPLPAAMPFAVPMHVALPATGIETA